MKKLTEIANKILEDQNNLVKKELGTRPLTSATRCVFNKTTKEMEFYLVDEDKPSLKLEAAELSALYEFLKELEKDGNL
jgi:hypothetical protein